MTRAPLRRRLTCRVLGHAGRTFWTVEAGRIRRVVRRCDRCQVTL